MSLTLQSFDSQLGLTFKYNLKEVLNSQNKSYSDVKSVTLNVTDTDVSRVDSFSNQIKVHPTFIDDDKIFIADSLLVQGDNYDAVLVVRFIDGSVLTDSANEILYSKQPSKPVVTVVPNDNRVTLTFKDLGLITEDFNGSTRISRVDITYHLNNITQEILHIPLNINSWPGVKNGNDWSYTITGLKNTQVYECQVSYENNTKSSEDLDFHFTPSEVPSAPNNLRVIPNESGKLSLSWSKPNDALPTVGGYDVSNYWIYRKEVNSPSDYVRVKVLNNVTSWVDGEDTPLVNGTTYSYKVRAALNINSSVEEQDVTADLNGENDTLLNNQNVGPFSQDVESLCFDTSIEKPTFSVLGANNSIDFVLNEPSQDTGLAKNLGNDYYVIEYKKQSSSSWNSTANILRTNTSQNYKLSGLVNGITYDLRVKYVQKYINLKSEYLSSPLQGYVTYTNTYESPYTDTNTPNSYNFRTPFSQVPNVTGLVSTPVVEDVASKPPLSTKDDGRLRLTWNRINYDRIAASQLAIGGTGMDTTFMSKSGQLTWGNTLNYSSPNRITNIKFVIGVKGSAINMQFLLNNNQAYASYSTFSNPIDDEISIIFNNVPANTPLVLYSTANPNVLYGYKNDNQVNPNVNPLSFMVYEYIPESNGVFTSSIRYRIIDDSNSAVVSTHGAITNSSDPSKVSVVLENFGFELGVQRTLKVEAYFLNFEEGNAEKKSLSPAQAGPDNTTQPFYYPQNGHNLTLDAADESVKASWNADANDMGGHDLRYELNIYVKNGSRVGMKDDLQTSPFTFSNALANLTTNLINGQTYMVQLSTYTTYLGERYYNHESLLASPYAYLEAERTPYSIPSAPQDFLSSPVDSQFKSLSTKTNGKLQLSWTQLQYDLIGPSIVGKFSNSIRYRIIDGLDADLVLNNYTDINAGSQLVENLELGIDKPFLRVQAYFYNTEENDYIYGYLANLIGLDSSHRTPFANPDDIVSEPSSTPEDSKITYSWSAGNGRGLSPVMFETKLDSQVSELYQSSPKVYENLTNGQLYNVIVKSYTEYTPLGQAQAVKYYATDSNNVLTNGLSKKEIPRKPSSLPLNLVSYPELSKFSLTFDAPSDLGGAALSSSDDFYLNYYRYYIKNLNSGEYVNSNGVNGEIVTKESELVVRDPLPSGQRYEVAVWAVTTIDGPSGVTFESEINGDKAYKLFSYFTSPPEYPNPDVHDLQITPADEKLIVTFGHNQLSDAQYEIILYSVDSNGALTDLGRVKGPSAESAPVDGVVQEQLTGLTNGQKYKVVVLVSTVDASGNRVFDSESAFGTPTSLVPSEVSTLSATNGDDSKTTLSWSAVSVTGKTVHYQVLDKDAWLMLDDSTGVEYDDTLLTSVDVTADNDEIVTLMVRAFYIDNDGNRVYGPLKAVQALPLPAPEEITAVQFVPGDKEVAMSWINVSSNDNTVYPKTQLAISVKEVWPVETSYAPLKTFTASNGAIYESSYTHNVTDDSSIMNGKKYKYQFVLSNNKTKSQVDTAKTFFFQSVQAINSNEDLVHDSDNSTTIEAGEVNDNEVTRPFAKPIVSANISGRQVSLTVSDNGRYVREVIVVGVPVDTAYGKEITVYNLDKLDNNQHWNWDSSLSSTDKNNVLSTKTYAVKTDAGENLTFDYDLKSVLYIVENEAGNTVAYI